MSTHKLINSAVICAVLTINTLLLKALGISLATQGGVWLYILLLTLSGAFWILPLREAIQDRVALFLASFLMGMIQAYFLCFIFFHKAICELLGFETLFGPSLVCTSILGILGGLGETDHARAHRQLSAICTKQGRQDEALAAAQRAVESDPEDAGLHHHLGNLLQKVERLDEAEAAHRRAIELAPDHARAYRQLSVIFTKQGRQDEALAAAQRAVECDPEDAGLHHYLRDLLQSGVG